MFCYGSKIGLATLVVSDQFFKITRPWRSEKRCTAFLIGSVFVMAVYAPDREKDLDVYETFIGNVIQVLWEGRRAGAKIFNIAGDLTVELGLLCLDDNVAELKEMYGPLCWR